MADSGDLSAPVRARPRGDVIPQVELQIRLDMVEDALTKGMGGREILAIIRERVPTVGVRTVQRYMSVVRERWMFEHEDARMTEREATINRLRRLSEKFEDEGEYASLGWCEKLLADVRGVKAAVKLKHEGLPTVQAPQVQINLQVLSDEKLAQLKEIARTLRQAQAVPASPQALLDD